MTATSSRRGKAALVALALAAATMTVLAVAPSANAGVFEAPWIERAECEPQSIGAHCQVTVCWVWQGVQHCE